MRKRQGVALLSSFDDLRQAVSLGEQIQGRLGGLDLFKGEGTRSQRRLPGIPGETFDPGNNTNQNEERGELRPE